MFQVFCLHHQRSNVFLGRRSSGQCISSPYGIYNVDHRVCQFSSKNKFHNDTFFVSAVNFHIFEAKSRLLQPVMSSPNNSTCRHTAFITVSETEGRACSGQSLFVCNSLPPSLSSQSFLKDIFSQNFFVNFVFLFGVLSRPLTFFLSLSSLSFSVTL